MDTHLILRAFLETARTGSFSEAARKLHVTPSVIAKRVSFLEARGGRALFSRTTREVRLTDAGQRYLPLIRAIVNDTDALLNGMRHEGLNIEGHIRLAAPPALSRRYLSSVLQQFLRDYPKVTLDMVVIDRPIDPLDANFDIVVGGFLTSYEGVNDIPLCPMERVICASPTYLRDRGRPITPHALYEHECLHNSMSAVPTGVMWSFQSREGVSHVDIRPKIVSNDSELLMACTIAGAGITILPVYVAAEALRNGEIVTILDDHSLPPLSIHLAVPERQSGAERVQRLVRDLMKAFNPVPWADWQAGLRSP